MPPNKKKSHIPRTDSDQLQFYYMFRYYYNKIITNKKRLVCGKHEIWWTFESPHCKKIYCKYALYIHALYLTNSPIFMIAWCTRIAELNVASLSYYESDKIKINNFSL